MSRRRNIIMKVARLSCVMLVLLLWGMTEVNSQPPTKRYTIKDGKMFIQLSKRLSDASLDSFIAQYDLGDLALKKFIRGNNVDSLQINGWRVEANTNDYCIFTKPLEGVESLNNPADKIAFAEKQMTFAIRFPVTSSRVIYGYNRFRNKNSFASTDSTISFFLRGSLDARSVYLAGSFNDWDPDKLSMRKTDSGWVRTVRIAQPGKYWYKFVVDGNWMIDDDNQARESDGLGNTNSVVFKTNHVFRLKGYPNARKVTVAGSFNGWKRGNLPLIRTKDGWELGMYLADGTHTYRYLVDDKWMPDPGNADKVPNEFNDINSVVRIGRSYLFTLDGYSDAKQVTLAGTFNGWRKDELFMQKTTKGWELKYTLGAGNYEYVFVIDGKREAKSSNPLNPKQPANFSFSIGANQKFRLKGFPNAKTVCLAGDFNGWSPTAYPMKRVGEEWVLSIFLSPGKHLYKFVVEGNWMIDPSNKAWEQNDERTGNSVIWFDPSLGPQ